MKTIEDIKYLMVGKGLITDLADLLRANDEEFAESEKNYLAAVEILRKELPPGSSPTLDDYLAACESDVISAVAYAGYLGFRVNLENFHHPIGINFVRLDTMHRHINSTNRIQAVLCLLSVLVKTPHGESASISMTAPGIMCRIGAAKISLASFLWNSGRSSGMN